MWQTVLPRALIVHRVIRVARDTARPAVGSVPYAVSPWAAVEPTAVLGGYVQPVAVSKASVKLALVLTLVRPPNFAVPVRQTVLETSL